MKKLLKTILFIQLPLFIMSCTTTPYTRYKTPNISGTLYINQEPAQDVTIYLSQKGDDKYCKKHTQQTSTGSKGEFSLASIKEQMDYTPLMTYYLDEWVVCADIAGTRKTLYSGNRYETGSVIKAVHLKCEIDKAYSKKDVCSQPLLSE